MQCNTQSKYHETHNTFYQQELDEKKTVAIAAANDNQIKGSSAVAQNNNIIFARMIITSY